MSKWKQVWWSAVIGLVLAVGIMGLISLLPEKHRSKEKVDKLPPLMDEFEYRGHVYIKGYKIGLVHAEHCSCKEE